MDTKKTIIVSGAGLLLLVVAIPGRHATQALTPASTFSPAAFGVDEVSSDARAASAAQLELQAERLDGLDWGRDPFFGRAQDVPPAEVNVEAVSPLSPARSQLPKLTGISVRGTARRALIGGEIALVGDVLVGGYVVDRITRNEVALMLDGKELILRIGEEE